MRALAVALALVACSASSRIAANSRALEAAHTDDIDGGAADASAQDVSLEARVASGEIAWLVAHLADNAERAHPGDSDAARRLAQMGPEGVRAVAEVFRVGDTARIPFARRVIERVVARRCQHDRARSAWVIRRLETGTTGAVDADAGVSWARGEARWPGEAVERVRRWADEGVPCDAPGADAGSVDAAL